VKPQEASIVRSTREPRVLAGWARLNGSCRSGRRPRSRYGQIWDVFESRGR